MKACVVSPYKGLFLIRRSPSLPFITPTTGTGPLPQGPPAQGPPAQGPAQLPAPWLWGSAWLCIIFYSLLGIVLHHPTRTRMRERMHPHTHTQRHIRSHTLEFEIPLGINKVSIYLQISCANILKVLCSCLNVSSGGAHRFFYVLCFHQTPTHVYTQKHLQEHS